MTQLQTYPDIAVQQAMYIEHSKNLKEDALIRWDQNDVG